jgi:hypothetical protein
MNTDQNIVIDFLNNPKTISTLDQNNNWANYLNLLHILLVKYRIRKTHVILLGHPKPRIVKNNLKLSKRLKIPMTKRSPFFSSTLSSGSEFLSNDLLLKIMSKGAGATDILGYSHDNIFKTLSRLTTQSLGSLLDYPDCCILWKIKSDLWDLETAFGYLKKIDVSMIHTNHDLLAETLVELSTDQSCPPILNNNIKIVGNKLKIGRKKFPFCFHQPCDECMKNENSPTSILNEKYAEFAKNSFPELYHAIIDKSKIEYEAYQKLEQQKKEQLDELGNDDYQIVLTNFDHIELGAPPPLNE